MQLLSSPRPIAADPSLYCSQYNAFKESDRVTNALFFQGDIDVCVFNGENWTFGFVPSALSATQCRIDIIIILALTGYARTRLFEQELHGVEEQPGNFFGDGLRCKGKMLV